MKNIIIFMGTWIGLSTTPVTGQAIKLMTYNIRLDVAVDGENAWNHRKDFFCSQMSFYAPTIFGIQEAMPHQVIDIATRLPNYAYVGIGREGEGKGESSNIFYDASRIIIKENHTFWLSETPNKISKGWDAAFHRVCTYALFKDRKTKKMFWVFNTHLDHIGDQARTKGIELILTEIKRVNTKNLPVILMGDFNSEPQEPRIIHLKNEMTDAREGSKTKPFGPSGSFNGFKFNEPVTKLIDYIFVSKSAAVTLDKYAILSDSKDLRYPSDHLPVYVEMSFK